MQKIEEVKNGKLEKIYVQKYYKNWLPAAAKKSATSPCLAWAWGGARLIDIQFSDHVPSST